MNWELILILTGIMLFAYWLNYIMGGPLSDDENKVDVRAILFFMPMAMAIRRLRHLGIYDAAMASLQEELAVTRDAKLRRRLEIDHRRNLYLTGREFFTWERSLLCPICLHWWLTVLVGFVFVWFDLFHARADFFLAAFVYLFTHFLIRKIS